MSIKPVLGQIEKEVKDVLDTGFEYSNTTSVPNSDDSGLTFERGDTKRGKELETCVLYTDIRDSVALTKKHHTQTMGRLYTAFTKAVLRAADHHNGYVRNIIGDRVMVIFPPEKCFKNAVDCAVTINHVSKKVINPRFSQLDFKCGIGIDFGQLRVIKVGIERKGDERNENKNLVWVGDPANIASRLTDVANKTIEKDYYEVKYNPLNMKRILGPLWGPTTTLGQLLGGKTKAPEDEPRYLDKIEKKDLRPEKFADSISKYDGGDIYFNKGKLVEFNKKTRENSYPPILITDEVYKGFKKEKPNDNSITKGWWKKQNQQINNVSAVIFGANLTWKV